MVETLSGLLATYGLLAIFAVMFLKEIGVPVPIPSDLIMIVAAAQAAAGRFALWEAFGVIMVAMIVGACVQYVLARRLGRPFLYRFGRHIGLTQNRLDRAAEAIRKGGAVTVGVSLVTPGLRITTVPACGLAGLPYRSFFPGLVVGSGTFLAAHFVIGYVGGPVIAAVTGGATLPMLAIIASLFAAGLGGWMIMRRRSRMTKYGVTTVTLERLSDWTSAGCPVCLVIGAVVDRRFGAHQPESQLNHHLA